MTKYKKVTIRERPLTHNAVSRVSYMERRGWELSERSVERENGKKVMELRFKRGDE